MTDNLNRGNLVKNSQFLTGRQEGKEGGRKGRREGGRKEERKEGGKGERERGKEEEREEGGKEGRRGERVVTFLGPHSHHMELPRLVVKSEL